MIEMLLLFEGLLELVEGREIKLGVGGEYFFEDEELACFLHFDHCFVIGKGLDLLAILNKMLEIFVIHASIFTWIKWLNW